MWVWIYNHFIFLTSKYNINYNMRCMTLKFIFKTWRIRKNEFKIHACGWLVVFVIDMHEVVFFFCWSYHVIDMKFPHSFRVTNLRQKTYETHKVDSLLPTRFFAYPKVRDQTLTTCLRGLSLLPLRPI